MGLFISDKLKQEICVFYKQKPISLKDMSLKFNLCQVTISKILKEHNINLYKKANIFNSEMKENFFENIDNEFKAYFLGLIISDGNVFKPKNGNRQASISITLHKNDTYILELFKKTLCLNTSINSDNRGCNTIAIRSDKMCADLLKYGVVENKSFVTYLPKINIEFMPHLLRGILDGDGSVQFKFYEKWNKTKHTIGFCGSNQLMNDIREVLINQLNLSKNQVYSYKDRMLSMITWGSIKDIEKIYHYLYDNATIFMHRKRNILNNILEFYHVNTEVSL